MPSVEKPKNDFNLLSFGRLLPYKGLDLLDEALTRIGPVPGLKVRVVGSGPESPTLDRLRALPNVTVENRWVPESGLGELLAWSDALVLPYREASQSGVAALALGAGRRVLATNVGGLPEQLGNEPLARLCDADSSSLAQGVLDLIHDSPHARDASDTDAILKEWREMSEELIRQADHYGLRSRAA